MAMQPREKRLATIVGVPDLQLVDLAAGTIAEASVGPLGEALGDSFGPCLSRDGRTLVFVSSASKKPSPL